MPAARHKILECRSQASNTTFPHVCTTSAIPCFVLSPQKAHTPYQTTEVDGLTWVTPASIDSGFAGVICAHEPIFVVETFCPPIGVSSLQQENA